MMLATPFVAELTKSTRSATTCSTRCPPSVRLLTRRKQQQQELRKKKADRDAQKLTAGALALLDAEHRVADRQSSPFSTCGSSVTYFSPPPEVRVAAAQGERKRKQDSTSLLEQQVSLAERRVALDELRMKEARDERLAKIRMMVLENERTDKDREERERERKDRREELNAILHTLTEALISKIREPS